MKYKMSILFKVPLLFSSCCLLILSCKKHTDLRAIGNPSNLRYISIADAREGKAIVTAAPTVETGGLTPTFELIGIKKDDGTALDASFLDDVSMGGSAIEDIPVDPDLGDVDQDGNPITVVSAENTAKNGIITIASGHHFTAGDYYFQIKVSTEANGKTYSTVFDQAFHLTIGPRLPTNLVYTPKNQNLVYGNPESKTTAPLMPSANPDVTFELATLSDKLIIDPETGAVSLSPDYTYAGYDTLSPIIKIISNISQEVTLFENRLTTIVTDKPEEMPLESIYFFYPTLRASGSFPTGGEGFTVQVDEAGSGEDIWGERDNSVGNYFVAPPERPAANTAQTTLETQTHNSGGVTTPTQSWMVTTTQDLTPFQYGYNLSFSYYYMPAFQTYMADGRTPTDLEVYISTDYTGGDIQDADGNWLNGTWTKVNEVMRCWQSEGTAGGNSSGAPWGDEFIGTPYPGNQKGEDPDGRKDPSTTFYNKWIKCTYDISSDQISSNFTVAFKVNAYFEGELRNNATAPGRGGIYFFTDFYYKAEEPAN